MTAFSLFFLNAEQPELAMTVFAHPLLEEERASVRGHSYGPHQAGGSFPWSAAVKALSILCLKTAADTQRKSVPGRQIPHLMGKRGSAAASLDYALSKQPQWLANMFGTDSHGTSLARRFLWRTNTEMKRPGPVTVAVNSKVLLPENVQIFVDSQPVTDYEELMRLAHLIQASEWPQEGANDAPAYLSMAMKRADSRQAATR